MGQATLERELVARREAFVHATVVRAQRPTSAHAGDTALVRATGEIDGFVGGTCVEASVRLYSLQVLESRQPLLLRVVAGVPSSIVEDGAVEVSNPCVSNGAIEIFLEPRIPLPSLVVVGSTPDADALAALAPLVGFDLVQADGATAAPQAGDAALIVASHGRDEEPALLAALAAGVPYIALVASPKRGAAVLASLDVSPEQRARVFSPAGLDLGARTPGEIAVSIFAQLVQERAGRGYPSHAAAVDAASAAEPAGNAIDPVCGMTVAALTSSLQVEHGGETVYFCAAGCRRAFLANPERYATAR
ncbi:MULTISPECIES: XdhC family protein [unclassified Cryobacterium]|uniref:XdhC family protein n=1 Tax=unclassified Cryobacterium TaxID=2649013 RepID=UPI0010696A12|nr:MULTISPECIES: XdhC family protein [unclassified Cryobacterium]TFD04186.1 YHS domain-containing protein [Cryobacterium sp. TMT1-66-1]TFD10576.1 YHS domain-containing protein [Cryobacterium sp. TMT1-2-2]